MSLDRRTLEALRCALIMLLNAIDDALGLPRTVPTKEERRQGKRFNGALEARDIT